MRPPSRSLTRGWVTRRIFAAAFCLRRRDAIIFWTWIIRSARIKRCAASSRNPRSRNTLPVERVIASFIRSLGPDSGGAAGAADFHAVLRDPRVDAAGEGAGAGEVEE